MVKKRPVRRKKKKGSPKVLYTTLMMVLIILAVVLIIFAVIKYIDNITSIYEDPKGYYFGIGIVIAIVLGLVTFVIEIYSDEKVRKGG